MRDHKAPLAGIRVVDLSWTWSGPGATACLADLGAEVIKVESLSSLDPNRRRGIEVPEERPRREGVTQAQLCGFDAYRLLNRGKLSFEADLKNEEGHKTVADLIARSDVLVENFTPGVIERLGFGWNDLQEINSKLIMVSLSALGRGGPLSDMRGYGPIMSAYSGVESIAGYSSDDVTGMMTVAYSDSNAVGWVLFAVMAALLERERDGRGVHVDISQTEASVATLVEPIVRQQASGADPGPVGAVSALFAPHGIYAVTDGWVAIAAQDDVEWSKLASLIGDRSLTTDEFEGLRGRLKRAEFINKKLASWCASYRRDDLVDLLTRLGVGCAPVLAQEEAQSRGAEREPGLIQRVVHPMGGSNLVSPIPWPRDLTGQIAPTYAPLLGEHNVFVREGILGRGRLESSEESPKMPTESRER